MGVLAESERELLDVLKEGHEVEEAAKILRRKKYTEVRSEVARIHRKLGVNSTAGAVAVAIRRREIERPAGIRAKFELSYFELMALRDIANDRTNKQIGARRRRSVNSSKDWVTSALKKLGARNRAHAVTQGFRYGFLA